MTASSTEKTVEERSKASLFDLSFYEIVSSVGAGKRVEYEIFCQNRVSKRTSAILLSWFAMCSIYITVCALMYTKRRTLFIIAAVVSVMRNPWFAAIWYFKTTGRLQGHKALAILANLTTIQSSVCMGLFLIGRVLNGKCENVDAVHMWSCNPEHETHALPTDVAFSVLAVPIMVSTIFKAVKWQTVVLSWFISVGFVVAAVWVGDAQRSIPLLVFYVPMSMIVIYENYRQDLILFLMSQKKEELLEENKQLAETAQSELRFMIANMAHDLKTPLSAFMNGIETLRSLFTETRNPRNTPEILKSLDCQIYDNIKNLFNVNQFMTMTVNRCIDYMKASKGIKLEPRLETINLQEVLSMPLNCMRDLQSRIAIMQKPIPGSVCSHIITDLQWFQENLFCLISNAVKYSSHGHITLTVDVIHSTDPLLRVAMAKKNHDNPVKNHRHMSESYHSVNHEEYAFLNNMVPSSDSKEIVNHENKGNGSSSDFDLTKLESGMSLLTPANSNSRLPRIKWSGVINKNKVYCTKEETAVDPKVMQKDDLHSSGYLLVEVEDTGIGLSDEAKEKLFTPFKQAQRRAGGTGLGLYSLAKRVDALGGYYGVSNRRDGEQGSIFWFAIPYRPDNTSVGVLARAVSKSLEEVASSSTSTRIVSPPSVKSTLGADDSNTVVMCCPDEKKSVVNVPAVGKLRILLVDDSHTILKMTSNLLKRHGHVVDQEENGADALKALERSRSSGVLYDVVLIDLNMPVMDGLEAMKRLRETERQLSVSSAVPVHQCVFAFTANSDRETMLEALGAGADDFISKPFSMQTFNEKYLMLKAGEMMLVEDV